MNLLQGLSFFTNYRQMHFTLPDIIYIIKIWKDKRVSLNEHLEILFYLFLTYEHSI